MVTIANLVGRLDLSLAWKKVKEDFRESCFIEYPYKIDFIDSDFSNWTKDLSKRIKVGYNPNSVRIIDYPKSGWHLRPGAHMSLSDNVIYSALLLDMIGKIRKNIQWSVDKKIRFSHILKKDQNGAKWFEFRMNWWKEFNKQSEYLMNTKGKKFVLVTDISAFYENIDLNRLSSDLVMMGMDNEVKSILNLCLKRWAEPRLRGIPQGHSPSDILSEVYLDSIDKELISEGFRHIRFSDDMRVFCDSKRQAIDALHTLTRLLRDKGLNLQTAKSKIMPKKEAINELKGIDPIVFKAQKSIRLELERILQISNPYTNPADIRAFISSKRVNIKLKSLEKIFNEYYISGKIRFNGSLFHFILNRWAAARNPYAVEYCFKTLENAPEETEIILRYFSNLLNIQNRLGNRMVTMIRNEKIFVSYQRYQVIKWFYEYKIVTPTILNLFRDLLRNPGTEDYILQFCVAYLGDFGDAADIDCIEKLYRKTTDIDTKATIIFSIRRMEKGRRNSIYNRAKSDDRLIDVAIGYAQRSVP